VNMSDAEEVRRLVEELTARAIEPPSTFLTQDEVATLTGRKFKSRQIEELKRQGVAFRINATGHAIVARSLIEGRAGVAPKEKKKWEPNAMKDG
jgi:hypothetical protein